MRDRWGTLGVSEPFGDPNFLDLTLGGESGQIMNWVAIRYL
jgi:hypothetical protein